jgi:hypothetical protein
MPVNQISVKQISVKQISLFGLSGFSLLAGAFCLYQGLGTDFVILDYEALDDYGIPIGIAFIAFAVLMARFTR